jgi:hypothetical protein
LRCGEYIEVLRLFQEIFCFHRARSIFPFKEQLIIGAFHYHLVVGNFLTLITIDKGAI